LYAKVQLAAIATAIAIVRFSQIS